LRKLLDLNPVQSGSNAGSNTIGNANEEKKIISDPIEERYEAYQKNLRETTGNPEAVEIQYMIYQNLKGGYKKFQFRYIQSQYK